VAIEPLDPVNINDVLEMINKSSNDLLGLRNKAIMLTLLDTGVRASELLAINLDDMNLITGEILIRQGKGRKPRYVFIGAKTRKAIRNYLKRREDNNPKLWVTKNNETLSYWGLKSTIRKLAKNANVNPPSIHAFRRWFALACLRSGIDVYSIQNLMGHNDLQVLRRYLKQTKNDIQMSHVTINLVD
jgi:integrase/recombinase XerC/integrase/recombinase XerD